MTCPRPRGSGPALRVVRQPPLLTQGRLFIISGTRHVLLTAYMLRRRAVAPPPNEFLFLPIEQLDVVR